MTSVLHVADMRSYLAAAGWRQRPDTWRGATLWDHPGGFGALVPPRDGMDDAEERSWELLQVLTKAEGRPPEEIAEDIASPMMDVQSVRTFPRDQPSGYISLPAGLRALEGIRDLFALSARSEMEGRRFAYRGNHPKQVSSLLDAVQLGLTKPGSYTYMMRVPAEPPGQQEMVTDGDAFLRRSTTRLYQAIGAAHAATSAVVANGEFAAFDEAVSDGVSANLCDALSNLAGTYRQQPFDIGFRWARGLPVDLPADTIKFGAQAGSVLRNAAKRLWRLDSSGNAQVMGLVESLHDDPHGDDRWRIRVRGDVLTNAGTAHERRAIWLRLTREDYPRAVDAHVRRLQVRAAGRLEPTGRRIELVVGTAGLIVDG